MFIVKILILPILFCLIIVLLNHRPSRVSLGCVCRIRYHDMVCDQVIIIFIIIIYLLLRWGVQSMILIINQTRPNFICSVRLIYGLEKIVSYSFSKIMIYGSSLVFQNINQTANRKIVLYNYIKYYFIYYFKYKKIYLVYLYIFHWRNCY